MIRSGRDASVHHALRETVTEQVRQAELLVELERADEVIHRRGVVVERDSAREGRRVLLAGATLAVRVRVLIRYGATRAGMAQDGQAPFTTRTQFPPRSGRVTAGRAEAWQQPILYIR